MLIYLFMWTRLRKIPTADGEIAIERQWYFGEYGKDKLESYLLHYDLASYVANEIKKYLQTLKPLNTYFFVN